MINMSPVCTSHFTLLVVGHTGVFLEVFAFHSSNTLHLRWTPIQLTITFIQYITHRIDLPKRLLASIVSLNASPMTSMILSFSDLSHLPTCAKPAKIAPEPTWVRGVLVINYVPHGK